MNHFLPEFPPNLLHPHMVQAPIIPIDDGGPEAVIEPDSDSDSEWEEVDDVEQLVEDDEELD
jgi:hypothetical protein